VRGAPKAGLLSKPFPGTLERQRSARRPQTCNRSLILPLFIRALPLSLGTLWHYVFLLPFVVIVCIPFLILTFLPLVGFLVSSAISTFFIFAGYRCALTAFGRGNEPSFTKLVMSSLSLGFMNTLAGVVIVVISLGLGFGLISLGVGTEFAVPGFEDIPFAPGLTVAVFIVLNSLYYCAMAVPMTSVAAAASEGARDLGAFFGFGTGIISLSVAWIVWFSGLILLGFIWVLIETAAIGTELLSAEFLGTVLEDPRPINWVMFGVSVLYVLWGTCWFSATAVLAWDRLLQTRAASRVETVAVSKVSGDDLRALRESRMPGGRGPQ